MYPTTVAEAVQWWDEGRTLWTIEMGGLGPGYEQALQTFMVEILRDAHTREWPDGQEAWDQFLEARNATNSRLRDFHLGLSGMQADAATNLAWQFLHHPWEDVLKMVESDRRIQISRSWPVVPVPSYA